MKRGRANPAAYSSTAKPAGTLICAPAGRGTMAGAFGFGGACASITAAREARARNDFMGLGYYFTRGCRMSGVDWQDSGVRYQLLAGAPRREGGAGAAA